MKKTNNKYNLSSMRVGQEKYFDVALYNKIRQAAHFTGKRHGMKFRTQKLVKRVLVVREA